MLSSPWVEIRSNSYERGRVWDIEEVSYRGALEVIPTRDSVTVAAAGNRCCEVGFVR